MATHERVAATTPDLRVEQIDALKQLFPDAVTEGKIDFDLLKTILGAAVDNRPERYSFSWAGKRAAIRAAQTPSAMTLVPAPGESMNFDATSNLFIEGDNLEVLKLLHRPYFGRVKMIYIDPPYNTGNDFVYPDDYADPIDNYLALTGQRGENGLARTSNSETGGRYHSNWLTMMYPRLSIAYSLLQQDGVILVSIDDTELANLKLLMNQIFGEPNFVAHIVWQKRYVSNVTAQFLSDMHDHILVYARNRDALRVKKLDRSEEQLEDYKNPDNDPRGVWRAQDLSASKPYSAGVFTITSPAGLTFDPPPGRYWRCNRQQYENWLADNRIWFGKSGQGRPMLKAFLSEVQDGLTPNTWWSHDFAGHNKEATLELKALFDGSSPFDTPKPVKLIRRLIDLFTEPGSLILDFFAGSCTTADAVIRANREDGGYRTFVMVQFPELTPSNSESRKAGYKTIADVGKERIRRVIGLLRAEDAGKLDLSIRETPEDLGFRVFKLAPSNLHQWQAPDGDDTQAYIHQLELMADTVRTDSQPTNVIWETALREGYSLTAAVERVLSGDATVYRVTDPDKGQSFYICLDTTLRLDALRPLRLTPDDLFICRDSALDDTAAANLALQCRLKTL